MPRPFLIQDGQNKLKTDKMKKTKFNFLTALTSIGISDDVARDWIEVRKLKKCANTKTAFDVLQRELEKIQELYQISNNDAITVCVVRSWGGCRCSFFTNIDFSEYGIKTKNNNKYGNRETFIRPFTTQDEKTSF